MAPDSASGDVTFYASSIAANANQESSGDGYKGKSLTLTEGDPVSTSENLFPEMEVYSANGSLIISSNHAAEITLYSISGMHILSKRIDSGRTIIPTGIQGLGVVHCAIIEGNSLVYKFFF